MSKHLRSALLGAVAASAVIAPLIAVGPAIAGGAPPTGQFLRHSIVSPEVLAGGRYGQVVARSGNLMAVGQSGNFDNSQAGKVFVYQRTGFAWSKVKLLAVLSDPAEGNGSQFGGAVSFIGNSIAVGAKFATVNAMTGAGLVAVYTRPIHGWANMSTPTAILTPNDQATNDDFGSSVATIGSSLVVGAPTHAVGGHVDQGAAYVFTRPANGWANAHQTAELTSSNGAAHDNFGYSVAATSSYVVVGAPAHQDGSAAGVGRVYVFVPGSVWEDSTETRVLADKFSATNSDLGYSLSANGQTIVAGSPFQDVNGYPHQGAVSVFREPDSGWGATSAVPLGQLAVLTAGNGRPNDDFGDAVSVSGHVIVVGAPLRNIGDSVQAGATYVFDNPSGRWSNETPDAQLIAPSVSTLGIFGAAVTNIGTNIVVGEPNAYSTQTRVGHGAVAFYRPLPDPKITHLTQSAKVWHLGRSTRALNWYKRQVGGDKISFTVNAPATITFAFTKINSGPDQFVGSNSEVAHVGKNVLFFDGQITPSKTIKPGKYEVTLTATTAAGKTSAPQSLFFTAKPEPTS